MSTPVRLGPFLLTKPIGQGGMGAVWHARHPEGVDVAVKVLKPTFGLEKPVLDAFRAEVRAVASLDHPHVVRVFDYGVVPAATAEASGGKLAAGAPWLAMAYASHGTLGDVKQLETWEELSLVLHQMLDALAHSHARQIVHRDLKPRNVLLSIEPRSVAPEEEETIGRPRRPSELTLDAIRVTLTDFGIAHALSRANPSHAQAGTPGYMAPEQIRGEWRTLGPWTDLYALGCLVWRLCTGHPPFHGTMKAAVVRSQLFEPPPRLRAEFVLPDGFEDWARKLMAKDPVDRFRCAADAAAALASVTTGALPHPILPSDWRPRHPPTLRRPSGTGLAMFLLRPWPIVGREAQQDALWSALGSVTERRRAAVAWLEGAAGMGRTRLASWLAERAVEGGVANALRLRAWGLRDQLRQALRIQGASPEEARSTLHHWLRLHGSTDPQEDGMRFEEALGASGERWAWDDLFVRLTHDRPLVLVVDDVQDADGPVLDLVERLARSDRPVLVLATARTGAPLPDALSAIRADATRISLGPLSPADQLRLIDAGGGLAPPLARRLVERTGGSPMFAVRTVSEWAGRGALVPTSEGYDLRADSQVRVPLALHRLLDERLQPLLPVEPQAALALEVLAVLGGERIREEDWLAACREAGVTVDPARLQEAAVLRRDRVDRTPRVSFDPALLRDVLLERSSGEGRRSELHRACGAALARLPRAKARERAAAHWMAAGFPEEALAVLRHLADEAIHHEELGRAAGFLDHEDQVLSHLGAEPDDPRRIRGRLDRHQLWARTGRGRPDPAAIDLALPAEDPRIRAAGFKAALRTSALPPERMDEARHALQTDPRGLRLWALARARALADAGELPAALRVVEEELASLRDDPVDRARLVDERLALSALLDRPEAEGWLEAARDEALTRGDRAAAATWRCWSGRQHRRRMDAERAAEALTAAREELAAAGAPTAFADLQLGLLRVIRGAHEEARADLEAVLASAADEPTKGVARAALLACHGTTRSWDAWDGVARGSFPKRDPDVPLMLEWAGRRAEEAGQGARAREVLEQAAALYRQHRDGPAHERVRQRLSRRRPDPSAGRG